MNKDCNKALTTALLGVPQANLPRSPATSPVASPRSRRASLEPEVGDKGNTGSGNVVSSTRRRLSDGDCLVPCLRDSVTGQGARPRRSKSMRVRFVRSPREVTQRLNEGSMIVGRSPPRFTEQPQPIRVVTGPSSPSPRLQVPRAYRSRMEDVRHGFCPPETPPAPPPSPPLTSLSTTSAAGVATPRGVAPRSTHAQSGGRHVAVARVHVRGDLDTSVIGEVHRENFLRYSGEYSTTSNQHSIVTEQNPKIIVARPPASQNGDPNQNLISAPQQVVVPSGSSQTGEANVHPQQLQQQKSMTRLLGDRENIKVTYTPCHPDTHTGNTSAHISKPGPTAPETTSPERAPAAAEATAVGQPLDTGAIVGRTIAPPPGANSRLAARVVIRRRRPEKSCVTDSDSDSVDRIDIDNRPQVGVRRAMSLRAPARQVWSPDQSVNLPAEAISIRQTSITPSSSAAPLRRAVSLRIMPKRAKQQATLSPSGATADCETKAQIKPAVERSHMKSSANQNQSDAFKKEAIRTASEDAAKVAPPTSVREGPTESASGSGGQSGLLASCMGGLSTNSTKWLAEQNRKRALKSLEPVSKFSSPPEAQPLTLCFEYQGAGLSHKTVLDAVEKTIHRYRDTKVVRIQYVPRSIILSSMWMENRWVVTVNNENAERALVAAGVSIFGKEVRCRKYDDVLAEEYRRFQENEEGRSAE